MTASSAAVSLPRDPVDAIVVGSGAAGSNMAARLAEGGKRVLILEAGPARSPTDLSGTPTWLPTTIRSNRRPEFRAMPQRRSGGRQAPRIRCRVYLYFPRG